jgi:hypothetical protein
LLKDYLASDMKTFFNAGEFGDMHNIDGREILIIMDSDMLKADKIKATDGTYLGDVLFYAQKSDFVEIPAIEQRMELDGELYKVNDIGEDNEMYKITLEAFMS